MAVKVRRGMMERLSALVLVGGLLCGAMITGGQPASADTIDAVGTAGSGGVASVCYDSDPNAELKTNCMGGVAVVPKESQGAGGGDVAVAPGAGPSGGVVVDPSRTTPLESRSSRRRPPTTG